MKDLVLIIEDEESIRKFIRINLERDGFRVLEARSGEEGIKIARKEDVDIVLLDLMLPNMDGYKVCKILRKEKSNVGIIMLTAKSQDIDKVKGLEIGTDDYITKPFNPLELVLRVKSLSRRIKKENNLENEKIIELGNFRLNLYSFQFFKNHIKIELTPTEFSIVKLFIKNPGKAFSRDEILNIIWGQEFMGDPKIVDVNIRRLRSKIEENPSKPIFIKTVWGIGYRWIDKR